MKNLQLTKAPIAKIEMLVRKPVSEVFEAFINPDITTKFWFTKSSGRLAEGKQVRWDWDGVGHALVNVERVEQNKRILIKWGAEQEQLTTVEWLFTSKANNATIVSVTNSGFRGDGDEVVDQALDATEGFTIVLAGAKALLEHNIRLNLVPDKIAASSK